ncbi:MAG: DUF1820 family protein [Gammaproteobacteria bacterium]|nr:DUF1820 family protein [Gammaproteobacteria bacterium]
MTVPSGKVVLVGLPFSSRSMVVVNPVSEASSSVVIDPTEERLRDEFAGANAMYLPMHSVLRIDRVEKRGQSKIRDREPGEKVTPLPLTRR